MITYNQYTVNDLRDWIEKGANNGLSEHIVSLSRANALLHCPCAKDGDVLVVSAMDGDVVVGYTAIFPEHLVRPDMWIATGTTLWVNPDYADDFVGYNLVQRLWQSYPQYAVIGSDVSPTAAVIDKLLGAKVVKYERKVFVFRRRIAIHSLRNLGSWLMEPLRQCRQRQALANVLASIPSDIHVAARNVVDAEVYEFIRSHSTNDTFLRSCEMLNWMLRYPFSAENPLANHTVKRMAFSDQIAAYSNHLLSVYQDRTLVGVVMLAVRNSNMEVKMLYTDDQYRESVYALIVETMVHSSAQQLVSIYPQLNAYLQSHHVALRTNSSELIFTYPKADKHFSPLVLQGADGDMFA